MKKIISIFMAALMVVCMGTTVSAYSDTESNVEVTYSDDMSEITIDMGNGETITLVESEDSEAEIMPMNVETLYTFNSTFWPSYEGTFSLNANRNLKLLFVADQDCTISFYKGNSVVPMATINLPGNVGSKTYNVKSNCSAGQYSFLLTTNSFCYAVLQIVSTEYI